MVNETLVTLLIVPRKMFFLTIESEPNSKINTSLSCALLGAKELLKF